MRIYMLTSLVVTMLAAIPTYAGTKLTDKAQNAVDPDCNVQKGAKGAAMKATISVGNRCGAAETARDVSGVDGKGKDVKKKVSN